MKGLKKYLHHFFVPHEENNYRAKALHLNFLTGYLMFALILTFGFKFANSKTGDILGYATDISINKLLNLTNDVRTKNNLSTLKYNEKLAFAAENKARDMFTKNYWAHYAPDGKTPWEFILATGYQYEYAGENLAKNFLYSQGVLNAWMNSPTHRDNILKPEYTEVGFAVVNGILNGEPTTLVVEEFAKPQLSPITKQPVVNAQKAEIPVAVPDNNILGKFTFNSNLLFMGLLMLVLMIDLYFAFKLKVVRIHSKNLAHLIFISFLIIGLLILTRGAII